MLPREAWIAKMVAILGMVNIPIEPKQTRWGRGLVFLERQYLCSGLCVLNGRPLQPTPTGRPRVSLKTRGLVVSSTFESVLLESLQIDEFSHGRMGGV